MSKKNKYFFKVLNHELFGGLGTEGYMCLSFTDKHDNPKAVARQGLGFDITDTVSYIEITEEEYLKETEEDCNEKE